MAEDLLTDDEQLEAVKRAFLDYAPWIVGGLIVGAGLLFGWRYYEGRLTDRALQAATQFGQMTEAMQAENRKQSRDMAAALIRDFANTPYADQAQLAMARMNVEDGRPADAVGPLTLVMNGSKDPQLKQIARLRLARVLIDQGKPDEAITLLGQGAPGSFAGRYHEVRADALYAKKDIPGAVKEYNAALGAPDAGTDTALLELKLADLASTEKAKP